MRVTPIKTAKVTPDGLSLWALLDESLSELQEGEILAVTSKIIALCEGNTVPADTDREALIKRESDYYLPRELSKYGHHFTVTDHTLIAAAGIDHSNGDHHLVLWPKDSQASANQIRAYLQRRFNVRQVGVIVTDSTSQPMRRGTTGIALAHSGFSALNDYIGQPDLFGEIIQVSQSNVAGGLAAAAVVAMGEGAEQTPLCVVGEVPFVQFQDHDPNPEELAAYRMTLENDLFAPFLTSVSWLPGGRHGDSDTNSNPGDAAESVR